MKVKSQKHVVSEVEPSKVKSEYTLLLTFSLFGLFATYSNAQQKNLPLNREHYCFIEKYVYSDSIYDPFKKGIYKIYNHTIFKPSVESENNTSYRGKSYIDKDEAGIYCGYKSRLFRRKLFEENLIIINDTTDKFHLTIDPLFNFEFGRDLAIKIQDTMLASDFYKNTRGILVRGDIGTKFSFESSFLENQATFVKYIDDHIKNTGNLFSNPVNYQYNVVPGQGRSKSFKQNAYDFAMASGYVSYSPSRHFNFQTGHGKHFVGDGYRSLVLSDNAFNYPFLRITSSFGKFQYTNLYASFMNLTNGGVKTPPNTERLFQKKSASFQFLSWNVHKRIQLGFFQGLIWESADTKNKQHLNLSYLSPVMYTSALTEGLQGTNNVLLGTTLKLKLTNSIFFYGQYMMDDFSEIKNSLHNKTGFQTGTKYFDVMGTRNLHLQVEYNQVRPYSYAHSVNYQSYTHYNQSLAHPLGANFKEAIVFVNYRIGDFFTELKLNYAIIGKDSLGRNYGNNIFNSDNHAYYGQSSTINEMGQGIKTTSIIVDFHIGYLVNPSTNFNIIAGISNRNSISTIENSQTNFVYLGIRTSLSNIYYDF